MSQTPPYLGHYEDEPYWEGYSSYNDSGQLNLETTYVCFGKGTLIETPTGYTKIEMLKKWDTVMSADGKPVKVLKVRKFNCPINEKTQPYQIMQSAFGVAKPFRDLVVSALHKVECDGGMVSPARLNDKGRKWVFPYSPESEKIEYFHVEVVGAVDIVANGIRAESLKPAKIELNKYV